MSVMWRHPIAVLATGGLMFCLGAWQATNVPQPSPRVRQVYLAADSYELQPASRFWIRVTEREEEPSDSFIAGAFYFFDSGPSESGPWKNVMMVHLDDPDPIPTSNVVFVNNKMAYVFLRDKLAVTTDAGLSWSSWELGQAHAEWQGKKAIIRNVILSADGHGAMAIEVFATSTKLKLHTQDFGKTWVQ